MLRNTIVLTNSEFSKEAIKRLYNNDALILKPPVDVKTFRKVALHSHEGQREDIILVVQGSVLINKSRMPLKSQKYYKKRK
jgi:hypothetical protein